MDRIINSGFCLEKHPNKMKKYIEKVKWGIIGCGDVTEVKSGPALQQCIGSELIAVMRRTTEKARDFARRHHVPKWYDDVQQLIHDEDVNAVYVATPPDTHAYYTVRALNAGKPVYVEKPMARYHKECIDMINAAKRNKLPLYVAYYRRMLPNFLKVKQLVDENAIGDIRSVNIRLTLTPRKGDNQKDNLPWRIVPEISGGGHFVDLASHQFDILDYILGPVINVCGMAFNQAGMYPAEDIVSAAFVFENTAIGAGEWCFTVDKNAEEDIMELKGSKGKITFSCFEHANVYLKAPGRNESFHFEKPLHSQYNLIQTVVNDLTGKGTCPSDGESGARTNRIMDLILKNFRNRYYKLYSNS